MPSSPAIKTKSSLFVERWANAEQTNRTLGYAVIALSIVSFVLVIVLVQSSLKPRVIYSIPGTIQPGAAVPATGATIANAFAVSWLLSWSNITPATIEQSYTRARKFMSPSLLAQTRNMFEKDMKESQKNNIASTFSLDQDPVVEGDKNGFWVIVRGKKGVYIGKEEVKIQQVTYRLRLRQINPTDANPYGMSVERIEEEMNNND